MTEFKRLINGCILLDGILWGPNPERAIRVQDLTTGNRLLNIRVGENYFYPVAIDKAYSQNYKQIQTQTETAW